MASLLETMSRNIPSPSQVIFLLGALYQHIFLLRFPFWYTTRFSATGEHATLNSFTTILSTFTYEWRMLIATSAFLLASNLSVLQIPGVMMDTSIRTAGFLSMAFASVSISFSVILILHFATLRREHSASTDNNTEGADDGERPRSVANLQMNNWIAVLNNAENERSVWWNASILLALPAIWTSWSAINFTVVFFLLLWYVHVDGYSPPTNLVLYRTHSGSFIEAAKYMPGLAATVVLAIGGVYSALMVHTLWFWIVHGGAWA